jgi:DNA invertase Pin-like site-specific DNA recombinase
VARRAGTSGLAFDQLWKGVARKEFDVVMVWAVDRIGRSLQHLVGFLSEIHAKKVDLFIYQQGLDTTTPAGEALFGMMGVFAQFERAMIAERVRAGVARAKAADPSKRWGRKPIELKRPEVAARITALRKQGRGMRSIADELGISSKTVWRFLHGEKETKENEIAAAWNVPNLGSN